MNRSVIVASLVAGALAVALTSLAQAKSAVVPPPPASWSYLCFDANGAKEVMEKANKAGARGWELVGASPSSTRRSSTWCFKQPSWARPAN
jgi:hypothetical protein